MSTMCRVASLEFTTPQFWPGLLASVEHYCFPPLCTLDGSYVIEINRKCISRPTIAIYYRFRCFSYPSFHFTRCTQSPSSGSCLPWPIELFLPCPYRSGFSTTEKLSRFSKIRRGQRWILTPRMLQYHIHLLHWMLTIISMSIPIFPRVSTFLVNW